MTVMAHGLPLHVGQPSTQLLVPDLEFPPHAQQNLPRIVYVQGLGAD